MYVYDTGSYVSADERVPDLFEFPQWSLLSPDGGWLCGQVGILSLKCAEVIGKQVTTAISGSIPISMFYRKQLQLQGGKRRRLANHLHQATGPGPLLLLLPAACACYRPWVSRNQPAAGGLFLAFLLCMLRAARGESSR